MRDWLLDATHALIERVVGPDRTPPNAGADTRLSEGYWLDSVELLEVVIACESEFGIVFDETHDLKGDAFETLGTLTDLIRSKHPTFGGDRAHL